MQLDDGLTLKNVEEKCCFMMTLKQVSSSYASKVSGNVIALFLEAHFTQAIMPEIILMSQDSEDQTYHCLKYIAFFQKVLVFSLLEILKRR